MTFEEFVDFAKKYLPVVKFNRDPKVDHRLERIELNQDGKFISFDKGYNPKNNRIELIPFIYKEEKYDNYQLVINHRDFYFAVILEYTPGEYFHIGGSLLTMKKNGEEMVDYPDMDPLYNEYEGEIQHFIQYIFSKKEYRLKVLSGEMTIMTELDKTLNELVKAVPTIKQNKINIVMSYS